ncbi:tripartite tricarboxylate transporter substrate-binding protein, partial [Achromobacter sp. DMS1]|uniref:tripartite tricarboxylate transporter substrate-binding protein n=1 Tax=Achromobacter sp. DMS1 TaxID=1688405 RepID=UPI002100E0A3
MFARAAGIQVNIVPYKGSSPAMNDLLGGHINAVLDNTGVQTPVHQGRKSAAVVRRTNP